MKHFADEDFWKAFDSMPENIRDRARKAFKLLKENPSHPSLHFKKVGTRWSARVSRNHRALAIDVEGGLLWYWIGKHDEYEREIE